MCSSAALSPHLTTITAWEDESYRMKCFCHSDISHPLYENMFIPSSSCYQSETWFVKVWVGSNISKIVP